MTVRLERIDQPDGEVALVLIVPASRADAWETVLGALTGLAESVRPAAGRPAAGDDSREAPGRLLKRLRTERNMTQKAVARLANVTQSRISDFENGVRAIPSEAARAFAECFGVSAKDFEAEASAV